MNLNSSFFFQTSAEIQKSTLLFMGVFFSVFLFSASAFAAVPTISSLTETSTAGSTTSVGAVSYYASGENLQITVQFSEAVNIVNTPQLQVRINDNLEEFDYFSGDGSNALVFQNTLSGNLNDWDGITGEKFLFVDTDDIQSGTSESLVDIDFLDVEFSGIKIDTAIPEFSVVEYSSTYGNVVGDIRYIKDGDKIATNITLSANDTRLEDSVSLDFLFDGADSATHPYTGSNTNGLENNAQKTTLTAFLTGKNGTVSLTNPQWKDQAENSATGTPTYTLTDTDANVTSLVVDTTLPVITISNPNTDFAESKILSASKDVAEDTLSMSINVSGTTCDDTLTFVAYAETTFSDEADNGKSICYKLVDYAGNETYEISPVISGIDTGNPEITSSTTFDTPENLLDIVTLVATDSGSVVTFSLTGGDDQADFVLSGTNNADLKFSGNPDFETPVDENIDTIYLLEITATDEAGHTDVKNFTITLTDENEAPEISSNGGGDTANISAPENQVALVTVEASDEDLPAQDLVFSVSGGADAGKFEIVSDTGVLTFVTSPDFETPEDLGDTAGNNTYEVEITVTDSGTGNLTDTQSLTIEVTDVDEIPPFIVISDNKPENTVNIASGEVTFTIQFLQTVSGSDIADPVTNFEVSDVMVTGGTPASAFASGTSGSDTYTLLVTPDASFEGDITLNIAAESATDLTGNLSLIATEYIQIVDTKSPTLSSVSVENGTPTQLTATFSEAVNVTDSTATTLTVVDASGYVLETKTISSVSGTGTNILVYTLSTPFQAEQIIKLDYVSASGNIQDLAENPLLDISQKSVTNNIAEGSAILSDISLLSDATNPSSKATVSWNTQNNVNGLGSGTLSTTDNKIEYGTTSSLGQTESLSSGSNHSGEITGLSANTVYYYRVSSVANGKTSTSQIFSFTTSRTDTDLHTDSTSLIQSFAEYSATTPYSSGWHFQFNITVDNASENSLQFLFDNWVSGENAFVTEGNVKMIVSSNGTTSTEAEISGGASVSTSYAGGDSVDISGLADGNPNIAGKQLVLDLYIKIPEGQAGGSYSTSYGIKTL